MGNKIQHEKIQWKAKCLSRLWARWLRKTGKTVDAAKMRELEYDLLLLLRKYQEEWGVDMVGLRLDPVVVSIRQSRAGIPAYGDLVAPQERAA